MMWKSVNGGCLIQTSQKSNPSVYDDYKKKRDGVITIGNQVFFFSNNRELKRILKLKKSLLVA